MAESWPIWKSLSQNLRIAKKRFLAKSGLRLFTNSGDVTPWWPLYDHDDPYMTPIQTNQRLALDDPQNVKLLREMKKIIAWNKNIIAWKNYCM